MKVARDLGFVDDPLSTYGDIAIHVNNNRTTGPDDGSRVNFKRGKEKSNENSVLKNCALTEEQQACIDFGYEILSLREVSITLFVWL